MLPAASIHILLIAILLILLSFSHYTLIVISHYTLALHQFQVGYFNQKGLTLSDEDTKEQLLKYIVTVVTKSKDAMGKGSGGNSGGSGITISTQAPQGRRNVMKGKEASITVEYETRLPLRLPLRLVNACTNSTPLIFVTTI